MLLPSYRVGAGSHAQALRSEGKNRVDNGRRRSYRSGYFPQSNCPALTLVTMLVARVPGQAFPAGMRRCGGTGDAGAAARWRELARGGPPRRNAVLSVMLTFVTSGCAFGTSHVVLPASLTQPMPAVGDLLSVRVKDSRTDLSGAQVGLKRNTYGSKTGSVELANHEPLADRLGRDLVAISRAKGFRASMPTHTAPESADVILDTDISIFLVDAKMGWSITLESLAVVRVTMVDASRQRTLWSDVVRVDGRKSGVLAVLESDHQELVEDLYSRLLSALRATIPSVVPR